jgi:hypothetical protein
MNDSLLLVALVISLTWMILYCFYLKEKLKVYRQDSEKWYRLLDERNRNTDNSVYALARALGYKRCPTLGFVKDSVVIK